MDTIAALSTAPGAAGLGVLRISGGDALPVLRKVFRGGELLPRKMVYGVLTNENGKEIDRPMAVYFPSPHSFTGEDVCELHCHGSPALLSMALEAVYAAGARPAKPGEFTKRAFLNGKLDLVQAEATGELIAAETEAAVRNAAALLGGALGRSLGGVYDGLVALLARFRAAVDYPDEEITEQDVPAMCAVLRTGAEQLAGLLRRSRTARAFTSGVDCAILGKPNVGKSSLLNLLCGEDRAIVTPIPGTTRDVVETRVTVGGVPLRLLDTAGIRASDDPVERLGIERAEAAAEHASLVLLVLDGSGPLTPEDLSAADRAKSAENCIIILNKSDISDKKVDLRPLGLDAPAVSLSALTGAGFDELTAAIRRRYDAGGLRFNGDVVTSPRQLAAIGEAEDALRRCAGALEAGMPVDMALTDAELALDRLAELFGRKAGEDVVEHIFAHFCVGK